MGVQTFSKAKSFSPSTSWAFRRVDLLERACTWEVIMLVRMGTAVRGVYGLIVEATRATRSKGHWLRGSRQLGELEAD